MKRTVFRKMGFLAVLCAMLAVFFCLPARADEDMMQLPEEADHVAVLYDVSTGYPLSEANAVAQTNDGFIYIGCYGGLLRKEGQDLVRLPEITSVASLYADREDGSLWIGTNDRGMIHMDADWNYTCYGEESGLPSLSVRSIQDNGDGRLLVGSGAGLCILDRETGTVVPVEDERVKNIQTYKLTEDSGSGIWGIAGDADMFCYKDGRILEYRTAEELGTGVNCAAPDRENEGFIYLGTKSDLLFHGRIGEPLSSFRQINLTGIGAVNNICFADGKTWILGDNGIYCSEGNGEFRKLSTVPMTASIHTVTEDYEGNLWFTSTRIGAMKLSRSMFSDLTRIAGVTDRVVNTTCMKDGKLYIGTDTGLVVLDSGCRPIRSPLEEYLKDARIRDIEEDSRGNLWFCTYDTNIPLLKLSPGGDVEIFNEEKGLPSNYCRTILERGDGSLAVATTGGIALFGGEKPVKSFTQADGLCKAMILCMAEDEDGKIYLGSDGDGIYVLDGDRVYPFPGENELETGVILNIRRDEKRNCFWIVTSNSGYYLKDNAIRMIPGFPIGGIYGNAYDVIPAENGRVWILGGIGIYVCDGNMLLAGEKPVLFFYDTMDGLPHVSTVHSRSQITPEGLAFLAGTDGVTLVDLSKDPEEHGSIKLAIPYIDVDGERIRVPQDGHVRVGHSVKRITVYGFVLSDGLNNPLLEYRLSGFDRTGNIVEKDELQPVSYTNLSGGNYTFRLAVRTSDGEYTGEEAEIYITKDLYVTEQPLFWMISFLFMIGGIRFLLDINLRAQRKKMEKEQEEKRIGAELNMAAAIQQSMVPTEFPAFPDHKDFDIYGYMKPAKEVGGDMYGFLLQDDDHLALVIADVSGKGVPGALYMMAFKILFENCATYCVSPAEVLKEMNEQICRNNPEEMFITAWLGILDLKTGRLTAASAGHEYPMLRKPGGSFEMIKDPHGFVLGGMEGVKYRDYELQMDPGATLFVYTDGVPEATDKNEKLFGTDRTLDALNRDADASPEELLTNVRRAVDEFVGIAPQFDDLTMLCVHYNGRKEELT